VAPDATQDQVRQAYLRLALQHHPDRLVDAGDEQRRTAADRMAEVNEAWAVLGDEGRRLRYDQELVRAGATSTAEDPLAHLVRRQRPVHDVEGGADLDGQQPPAWVRVAPLLVILGVLAAIVVFTAYAGDDEPSGRQAVQTATEVPVGTCVTLPPTGEVVEVECGRPSDGTVALIVGFPQPCPVPLLAVPRPEQRETLCLRD
jgi:hypothetical protein